MASDGEISCTNDPNFAIIYSFLKVFGKLYSLDVPSIVKLQELIENTEEVLEPLKELHLRLLRRALKSVQSNKWERALIKFCHQRGYHQEAWELERFSYKKASTPVKLKILKWLLEYQFTCYAKFKSAVNAISCKDLRIDPIGSDKNGCVYWLQVDDDANICLYKEDQDDETWQLIARNKEEFAKVIDQLKKGEEITPSSAAFSNEDTNSGEISMQPVPENKKSEPEDDNDEEFLSPESESDPENDDLETDNVIKANSDPKDNKNTDESHTTNEVENDNNGNPNDEAGIAKEGIDNILPAEKQDQEIHKSSSNDVFENPTPEPELANSPEPIHENIENKQQIPEFESKSDDLAESVKSVPEDEETQEFSAAIEEPVMIITGEGNGAECESSFFLSEEICEPVMFIYGEGCGYDNDTGNPDIIEQENNANENTEDENEEESLNGAVTHELSSQGAKTRSSKGVKVRTSLPAVTRRMLKKQSNDSSESPKSDPKKHCIRDTDLDKSGTSNSDVNLQQTETPNINANKNNVKKRRAKIKKKIQQKNHIPNEENNSTDKTSIIEKRKSSVSSIEQDDGEHTEAEKEKSPDKELKAEDTLPTKKIRLETSPESDVGISHSNDVNNIDNVNNEESDKETVNNGIKAIENEVILKRKKITPVKGKHKKIRKTANKDDNELNDICSNDSNKKANKSLKRTLMDATMSDKNKTESPTESDGDEDVTSGKRLKIKPKKIIMSSRKKVEAKLQEKNSSDESEEETLYSLAGKKGAKKSLKKKLKSKEKVDPKIKQVPSDESDLAPVRQSRRIAQLKIKEEADRRNMEEVALKELKKIHKKKNHDDEEEWKASGASSSEAEVAARKKMTKWRNRSVSTGPEPDSESDEPIFEHEEPDLEFTKSDHEFSPESDLENGEPVEPMKLARTLQKDVKDDGFCKRCGSGEQPEWILLCDRCDDGFHASCLKPMLFLIPEGDWFCPPCNHQKLIEALEKELVKIDELTSVVEAEKARKLLEEPPKVEEKEERIEEKRSEDKPEGEDSNSASDWSSTSEEGAVYRLRARKQLPVSYRSQEYDRLISSAIKEEYREPTSSAGNQGRGKDISTIMEAAEEEKLKAEREALEQGKPIEKKIKKRQRRKPRKLNSLEDPSEDDGETDEDFKDTGMESSSESISTSAERATSSATNSSDDLPIRRTCRSDNKKERTKMTESSPEVKKKKKVFDSSSESGEKDKDWSKKSKSKKKSSKKRDRSGRKGRKRSGLTQYDAEGNVIRARVTYGGLSGDDDLNDWSPKHRTRQKKINYTEMPNTESEDEMHKSSGKHMLDSSDEFKITSDSTTDSESERKKKKEKNEEEALQSSEEKKKALCDLIKKTAVVPLEKLPEDVTKAKTEELQAHLLAASQSSTPLKPSRGKSSRGRGNRGGGSGGGRGRGGRAGPVPVAPPPDPDDELAKLVGVKIKDLRQDDAITPLQAERERKRQEREAKLAEKEAKRIERLQKKEEKEKLKEMKAKEREEKRLARIALQESKRVKKEAPMGYAIPVRPMSQEAPIRGVFPNSPIPVRHPGDFPERFPAVPRLQVRAELRGVLTSEERLLHRPEHQVMREGTLSVAGSPQPFKPVSEEPSIITRMPHMLNQQYRGQMYPNNSPYGPRTPQNMMYSMHHMNQNMPGRPQYPPQGYYPHMRGLPPGYPTQQPMRSTGPNPSTSPLPPGSHGPPGMMHRQLGPQGQMHRPPVSSPLALGPQHPMQHRQPHPGHPQHMAMHGYPNTPPRVPPPATPPHPIKPPTPNSELAIKIKAEVKTEPEYNSPPTSPPQRPPSPKQEPIRNHPKIKHTESKDRKPRFPLGPYAPQYGPYGPYAPPHAQQDHSGLLNLQSRMPLHQPHMQRMMHPGPHQYLPPAGMEEKPEQSRSPIQRLAQMERSQMERAPHVSMEPPQQPMSERSPYLISERNSHPMSERSPHPMTDRLSHPMSDRSPHPMSERSPHPMTDRPPHPMTDRTPHPMSDRSPHAMADRSPHPMSERQPHPMAERQQHPMAERQPNPMSDRSPHPMSERSPHPMTDRLPHSMSDRSPHPLSDRSTHPMSDRSPHPMSDRSPHPMSDRSPHPMSDRSPHPMSERQPHPMSDRSPHPMSERSPHPMSERSPHAMSERPPHPMSERSPHMMTDRPPHLLSDQSPHPMSERSPHPMSDRSPHPMSDRSPHPMSERSPHPMSERPPHHLTDRPAHLSARLPHLIPDRPTHPHDRQTAHLLMNRPPHPMSERPHMMSERPQHPLLNLNRPQLHMQDRPHHLSERLSQPPSERHEYLPQDRHPHSLSERPPHTMADRPPLSLSDRSSHPLSERPPHPSTDRSPHQLSEHQIHPIPEHSPHNLSDRPPHHLSDRSAHSMGDRPQHLLSERPTQPGHLSHGLSERPPHPLLPPDMTRLPPHYLPPPHLQSQLRPQYGMPMIRHPGRNSPGTIPPHYPQHFPEIHKPLEKPMHPALPQTEKPQSPGFERDFSEPNGQTVPEIKKENIDNDEPPSPGPPEIAQPLHKLGDHVNRPLDNEPLKQLQEIKTEDKEEEDVVDEPPPREEGSVFGGLVSYFSSQREDDIDA